jgi:selenocysteine-specific elongation factor
LQDARLRANAVLSGKDFVEYCIRTAKSLAVDETQLAVRAKIPPGMLRQILSELTGEGKALNLTSKLCMHGDTFAEVEGQILDIVGGFHRSKPESPGLTAEQLYEASRLEKGIVDGLIKRLVSAGKLVERKHRLALASHEETFTEDEDRLLKTVEAFFRRRPFNPPKAEEIVEQTKAAAEEVDRILRILTEQERLVRVEHGLFFHSDAIEQARQTLISFIRKEGRLESVKFKYLLDTTRKFAIPLLDYFDRVGVLRRAGNTRYLKEVD